MDSNPNKLTEDLAVCQMNGRQDLAGLLHILTIYVLLGKARRQSRNLFRGGQTTEWKLCVCMHFPFYLYQKRIRWSQITF